MEAEERCILKFDSKRFIRCSLLIIMTLVMVVVNISCTHHKVNRNLQKEVNWDSITDRIQNVDSLKMSIAQFTNENNKEALISSYRSLAKLYRLQYKFAEAIAAHRRRLSIALELNDTLEIVESLNDLGKYCRRIGEYNLASSYYYKVISYTSNKVHRRDTLTKNRVEALNAIGEIFVEQDNWQLADSSFHLALKGEKELGHVLGMAINYSNLGYVFQHTGQTDSAWMYYRRALRYNTEGKSDLGIARNHMRFGELYEQEGKWDKALKEHFIANKILSNSIEKWYWIKSNIAIARVYKAIGEIEKGRHYLKVALEASQKIGAIQHISDIYHLRYQLYAEKGDSKKALEYYVLSRTYSDSVINTVKMNQMFNTRMKFTEGAHQIELESIKKDYNNQRSDIRNIVITFMIYALIVTIIFVILFRVIQTKRKLANTLRHLEQTRSNFFTNITHEFRTPLTVILGFSRQLEKESELPKDKLNKIGSLISYQGSQLLNLVNQLLDYSKIESSIGTPTWCRGNIVAYINMIVESFQEYAQGKHNELVFISKDKTVEMDFVPDYVDKIMRNLISNAFKFTPKYGKVYITASVENNILKIYVADNGTGISDEDKPHIFDPFYQSKDKSIHIGTGIGLSLVYQLVKAMEGTISVKSSPNEGSVFILKLPLLNNSLGAERFDPFTVSMNKIEAQIATKVEELPEGKEVDDTNPLILIVEDNTDVAYYIGSQLQHKYTLKYARNGRIAMEIANDLIPDLIISDLIMPEMSGYEVCHQVRESELLNHIPIILISALNTKDDRIRGLEAGADTYLTKPFNSDELNERIQYLLEQRKLMRMKYSNALQKEPEIENITQSDQDFINKLVDITYSAMVKGEVTVEMVAEKMMISRQLLNKKIQAITGESAVTYLMRIRLNKAKMLLDSPENYLIGDIAMKCGFEDTAYFSRIFKKTQNMTPSQYKRRMNK